jgi:mono/diheme cytochrome c family protein
MKVRFPSRIMHLPVRLAALTAMVVPLSTTSAEMVAADAKPAAAGDTLVLRGRGVYQKWCVSCHGVGQHSPGTAALQVKYQGKLPALLTQRGDLSADLLAVFVRNGISVMPSFRPTEVSNPDLEALAAYLKSASTQAGP